MEHFLTMQSFYQVDSGEAFVIDDTGNFLATLNINNHIQFELLEYNGNLESGWNHLVKIETFLGKSIQYAFSPKFGFLTSDFTQCGTALLLTVFLQPTALIQLGKLEHVLEKITKNDLMITGLQGDPQEFIGDVLAIHNHYTVGVTEENIISSLELFTTKLMIEENSVRSLMKQKDHPEIKDKVSRAYGILIHSYQLNVAEALNAISLMKLGLDMGWVKGVKTSQLNQLFFNFRRAHLLSKFKEEIEKEKISHKRAEFIHQALKGASLTI